MSDGQVIFEITADGKHAIASVKDVTKAIESESKKWDKSVDQTTEDMSGSFASMAKKVVAGLSAAKVAQTLFNWGKAAIEAASDLREVQNVVDVTFGESASAIEAWAKKAGEQFGLTETQAKKFTSTLGAMAKSAGLSGDEIVTMSTDLAGLAADMASFYNLDFETAFQKIRSGISGETEPLKQLGVNMSVANLEAYALQKGLSKTFNEMTQGEQVMLRYQYIMQATADAQGDFARTSDGYANASRRIETALESIKTSIGNTFMPIIEEATAGLAGFLENLTKEPERTVLDDFNDIKLDTAQKMAVLEDTYAKAQNIIRLLSDIEKEVVTINGKDVSLGTLFTDLGKIESEGGNVRSYLQDLGVDVDYVSTKYQEWKHGLKEVSGLVPSLTELIDSETGAIEGGTDALQDNLDAWKANEEKKLQLAAVYAQKRALEEKKAEMYMYQFESDARNQRVKDARAALENIYKDLQFDDEGKVTNAGLFGSANLSRNAIENEKMQKDIEHYNVLLGEATTANAELQTQVDALNESIAINEAGIKAYTEKYGELEDAEEGAKDAVEDYMGVSSESWAERTAEAQEALTALSDYVQAVRDATAAQVDSAVSGFTMMKTAKQQNEEAANALEDLRKQLEEAGKYSETDIEIKLNAANAQITLNKLNESLQSQLDYMREYQENLQKAADLGVSENVLASLSDGSNESARQLYAIIEAYNTWQETGVGDAPADIEELNRLYEEVAQEKTKFTDSLTQQKLAVDETYDAMVDRAMTAIEELNMADEAAGAMYDTVEGIAEGIGEAVPDVAAAVDEVIAQLERLNNYGIGFGFDAGGLFMNYHGSHEAGLDYVPFDGYLAKLHEGEGILKAEENRVWQQFKAGQRGATVDYDTLGGVMRDNVKAGGNVYLDGRAVGQVVSQIQGNQYRSMTRSGWQQ